MMEAEEKRELNGRGEKAAAARRHVAGQIAALIEEASDLPSREQAVLRLQGLADAERTGDPAVIRAAVVEVSRSFGLWAARLDLSVG